MGANNIIYKKLGGEDWKKNTHSWIRNSAHTMSPDWHKKVTIKSARQLRNQADKIMERNKPLEAEDCVSNWRETVHSLSSHKYSSKHLEDAIENLRSAKHHCQRGEMEDASKRMRVAAGHLDRHAKHVENRLYTE